jgi:hypothetical protein
MAIKGDMDVLVDSSVNKSELVFLACGQSGGCIFSSSSSYASTVVQNALRSRWSSWACSKNLENWGVKPIGDWNSAQVDIIIGGGRSVNSDWPGETLSVLDRVMGVIPGRSVSGSQAQLGIP